jgi:hypothetical protein
VGLDPRLDEVFRRCYCRVEKRYASAAAIVADLAPLASRRAVAEAAGPVALPVAHLEPSIGAPPDASLAFLSHEAVTLEGGARIELRDDAWWISAGEAARGTTIRPAKIPADRKPEEFETRVGAQPLRLAEGVVISVEGDGRSSPPMCFVFHDGVPTEPGSAAQVAVTRSREGRIAAQIATGIAIGCGFASLGAFALREPPVMMVFALLALGFFIMGRILGSDPGADEGAVEGTLVPPARVVLIGRPAGFFVRALAFTIDAVLLGYLLRFLGPRHVGMVFLYDWLFTAAIGGTVGKFLLGLRVVTDDGEPVGVIGALVRTLAKLLSLVPAGLGFLLAGLTPSKQALHDFFAGTRVIYRGE